MAFLHEGQVALYGTYREFVASSAGPIRAFLDGAQTSRLARIEDDDVADTAEITSPAGAAEIAIELCGVHKHFGEKHVLRGVDMKIPRNMTTVVIGASGSGKSVIIKHIMGLFKPDAGEILVFGQNIVPLDDHQLNEVRRRFGLLFQHAALLDWLTVRGNVAFPLEERRQTPKAEIRDRVSEMLERTHIADIADKLPGQISEGQKKRVGLARALIMRPEIMIYDEPTTGQDPLRTRDVRQHDPGDPTGVRHYQHRDQPRHGIHVSDRGPHRPAQPRSDRGVRQSRPGPGFHRSPRPTLHLRRTGVSQPANSLAQGIGALHSAPTSSMVRTGIAVAAAY